MNYNEFAQKIKAKYPDYSDMDNLELAKKMVSKFPDDYGDVTFEQPKQPTYKEQAPGLLARVKETGYTGLSDNDKRLYDAQYPHSQAGRSGMSLEEARKMADEFAAKNKPQETEEKGTYQKVREFIVPEVAQTLSPLEYWKDRLFTEGKQAAGPIPYAQYVEDNIEAGNKGEGIVGMIGDPATTAQIIASGLTGGGSILAEAAIGGLGNIASYYGNTDSTNTKDALLAGGIGSILGGASAGLFGSPSRRVGKREMEVGPLKTQSKNIGLDLDIESTKLQGLEQDATSLGIDNKGVATTQTKKVYDEMFKNNPLEKSKQKIIELNDIIKAETDEFGELSTEGKLAREELNKTLSRSNIELTVTLAELWERTSLDRAALSQLDQKINNGVAQGLSKDKITKLKAEKAEIEKSLKEIEKSPYYPLLDKYIDRKVGGVLFSNPFVGAIGDVAKSMVSDGYKLIEPAIDRVGRIGPVKVVTDKIKSKSPVEWVASTRPEEVGALISNLAGKYAAEKTLNVKKSLSEAVDKVQDFEERKRLMHGKKK